MGAVTVASRVLHRPCPHQGECTRPAWAANWRLALQLQLLSSGQQLRRPRWAGSGITYLRVSWQACLPGATVGGDGYQHFSLVATVNALEGVGQHLQGHKRAAAGSRWVLGASSCACKTMQGRFAACCSTLMRRKVCPVAQPLAHPQLPVDDGRLALPLQALELLPQGCPSFGGKHLHACGNARSVHGATHERQQCPLAGSMHAGRMPDSGFVCHEPALFDHLAWPTTLAQPAGTGLLVQRNTPKCVQGPWSGGLHSSCVSSGAVQCNCIMMTQPWAQLRARLTRLQLLVE